MPRKPLPTYIFYDLMSPPCFCPAKNAPSNTSSEQSHLFASHQMLGDPLGPAFPPPPRSSALPGHFFFPTFSLLRSLASSPMSRQYSPNFSSSSQLTSRLFSFSSRFPTSCRVEFQSESNAAAVSLLA